MKNINHLLARLDSIPLANLITLMAHIDDSYPSKLTGLCGKEIRQTVKRDLKKYADD